MREIRASVAARACGEAACEPESAVRLFAGAADVGAGVGTVVGAGVGTGVGTVVEAGVGAKADAGAGALTAAGTRSGVDGGAVATRDAAGGEASASAWTLVGGICAEARTGVGGSDRAPGGALPASDSMRRQAITKPAYSSGAMASSERLCTATV